MIDLHSHILPGIDDGAPDIETSVALVSELAAGGVTDVVATPHYMEETIYISPAIKNRLLLKDLQKRLDDAGIEVKVHLGNEIYISKNVIDLVRKRLVAGLFESSYILVELPMSGDFPDYYDIFLELIRAGYKVVLAHPERYTSFQKDFSLIDEMYEMGVLLQCNIGSFAGQYGRAAMKTARKMAKAKMIWGVGTDIHHSRGDGFVALAIQKMGKYYSDAELAEILVGNPEKIFR